MKTTLPKLIVVLLLGILSCKKENAKEKSGKTESATINKPYFNYDEIEFFHNDANNDLNGLSEIYDKLEEKKIDSLEFKVLVGSVPESIADSAFIEKLNQIGFHEIPLSEKKQNELRKIFVEKHRNAEPKDALKPIFNDVFIFKKNKKIVGFSTMSFKYLQSRIIGSEFNSDYFPTNSEHKKIEKILFEK